MASSYSTDLKLELMVTGENAGTWGDKTNSNLNLIQQAIAGYEAVTITDSTTTALVMSDASLSNARNMVIKIATVTLTGATTVTIPDGIEKFYVFDLTAVTGVTNLTIKTVSGTGFTAGEAKIVAAYSDGTNLNEIALNTLGGTIASAQIDDNAITAAKISNNAVTTAKILQSNVTTAKLAASAVTGNNIAQSTITQTKLATDSVGPDQLISTGVTAAEYTSATITVDADGRITAASSGAGSTPDLVVTQTYKGPSSGTFTAQPGSAYLGAFIVAGGGNAGNQQGGFSSWGGNGGYGGWGYFGGAVTAPFSTPYSVGGPSNLTGVGQANAGNAGENGRNSPGNWPPGNPGTVAVTSPTNANIFHDYNYNPGSTDIWDQNFAKQVLGLQTSPSPIYYGVGGNTGAPPTPAGPGVIVIMESLGS